MSELKQPRMSPGMREMMEAMHKASGQPERESFLSKLFTPAQPDRDAVMAELIEALDEAEDYFENRADAEHGQDGPLPNTEMILLVKVREALAKADELK